MTSIRLLPSQDAIAAAEVLDAMLREPKLSGPSDRLFASDHGDLWRRLAEGGWLTLGVSEAAGGPGLDLVDLALIAEGWGCCLIPLPFLPTLLVRRWSGEASADAQRLTFGLAMPAWAGGQPVVPFGNAARVVERVAPLSLGTAMGMDVSDWAPSLPLGRGGAVTEGLSGRSLQELAVLGAADLVGCGTRLVARSVAYAKERVQFDHPIADYQAVQHMLANMHADVEMARTAVVLAANEPARMGHAIALAWDKIRRVTEIAVQVHGGFGFTWEAGLHFYERHVWAWRELFDACGVAR